MIAVIEFDQVSKSFKLGQNVDSLRDLLVQAVAKVRPGRKKQKRRETFWALRDLDFKIDEGTIVGLIGHNGSGKSTTLKLLAGILRPDKGFVRKQGRVGALIEVGAGFHGDLTGRENVYLNGSIVGMKKREIDQKFEEIISFAGVEEFIDTPVKRFSSGMYLRLGFSVVAHLSSDILLIDEVLAVGDGAFQTKCIQKIKELKNSGTTIIFVSHHMGLVEGVCDEVILLEHGRKIRQGPPEAVISYYQQRAQIPIQSSDNEPRIVGGVRNMEITAAMVERESFQPGEILRINFHVVNRSNQELRAAVGISIVSEAGLLLHNCSTSTDNFELSLSPGENVVCFETEARFFLEGTYFVSAGLREGSEDSGCVDWKPSIAHFNVIGTLPDLAGFFSLPRRWRLSRPESRPIEEKPALRV